MMVRIKGETAALHQLPLEESPFVTVEADTRLYVYDQTDDGWYFADDGRGSRDWVHANDTL